MYNLGEYTRMKINVLHCIICSGWVLLLFCPAIISQTKHFLQKNSSTQINLGEGEGTYSFSSEIINCTLTSFFLCSMFNEWSSVGCHNGKSLHEEYFAQTHCCPNWERNCSRNDLQSQPKSPIYKGAANKPILAAMPENGPEEKAAVCSTFLKSLFTHFCQMQIHKYRNTNTEVQIQKYKCTNGSEEKALLFFTPLFSNPIYTFCQMQIHKYRNSNTQVQIQKYKCTNWSEEKALVCSTFLKSLLHICLQNIPICFLGIFQRFCNWHE